MGLSEPCGLMLQGLVHDRVGRRHDFVESWSISVRGPPLETVFRLRTEATVVLDQVLDAPGRGAGADLKEFCMQGIEEDLQRGQPLLTVDNDALLQFSNSVLHMLQDDGPKKMGLVLGMRVVQKSKSDALQILPQRFPLLFFVPHIRSLEQRDQEALRLTEYGARSSNLGFHEGFSPNCGRRPMIRGPVPFPFNDKCAHNRALPANYLMSASILLTASNADLASETGTCGFS